MIIGQDLKKIQSTRLIYFYVCMDHFFKYIFYDYFMELYSFVSISFSKSTYLRFLQQQKTVIYISRAFLTLLLTLSVK